ncbi:gamma-mobile-trio protein GmtX [Pseudomonas helleri]|uniref:Alpha/beta hydrolase n=1 Tax=Pseudomonas helleri TaxID=1608996 RepID=A0A7X1YE28_9PSED|nr:gamma-mobile-trio protein GmtX [Pseudomonas helleri]MQT98597.1 alpha/beta hydrolase [Pseudomonas helleri]MQU35484.1 alpha/beta hydrolase [Pseudomonas helleri]
MNGKTDIHPNAVLESLLAKGGRSNRRAGLAKLHEICRRQYETGSRNFTLPAIGRLAEAEGIIKGRVLYNAQSSDYRTLIEAWGAYAGPPALKPPKMLASHEYLMRIEDPAIRSIMQAIIAERDKLKAQLNVLKAHTEVTVDRRPLGAIITSQPETPVTVFAPSAQLTPSEREALKKAVSSDYLEERGLREGSHGEIVNERGRIMFDVGFTRAIRKILGDSTYK